MQSAGGKSYVAHQLYRTAIQQEYATRTQSMPQRGAKPQKQVPNRPLTLLSVYIEKYPTCFSTGKINVIEKGIEEIDVLPLQYKGISTLFLSNNRISDLAGVTQFPRLRSLSLAYNDIVDISQLEYLSALPNLRTLRLDGNGIARHGDYRLRVIAACTSLQSLDGQDITETERKEASRLTHNDLNTNSESQQMGPVVEIAHTFSPKSLREKLKAAQETHKQAQQNDLLLNSTHPHADPITRTNDHPISNASLVRDLTIPLGDQPSTILKSLHEVDRDEKDVFDRKLGSNPQSIELFPNKMNIRTFSELTEMDSQNVHQDINTTIAPSSQIHKQAVAARSISTEQRLDPITSLTQANTTIYNQIADFRRKRSNSTSFQKHTNSSFDTSFQSQKNPEYVSDLDNTGMIIGDLDVKLSSNQSIRSPQHTGTRYSLSSPQELQSIIAEQAKELSILRAKQADLNSRQHSFSYTTDTKDNSDVYDIVTKLHSARIEHLATLFNKMIKRATLKTFIQNCRTQIKLRRLEDRVGERHRIFLLSKYFPIIKKVAQDYFKSMILKTAILPQQRLRNVFVAWKAHVSGLNAYKSQAVVRRDLNKATEYYNTHVLQRIALISLCVESERRTLERSQRYARWLEMHGPPRTDMLSMRGILDIWREKLSTIRDIEFSIASTTRIALIRRTWNSLLERTYHATKIRNMIVTKERAIMRSTLGIMVRKYLRMRQNRILIQLLANKFDSVLRKRTFNTWRSQVHSLLIHPAIQRFIELRFRKANESAAHTLLKRSFNIWRYSSDNANAILVRSLYVYRNRSLALLVLGSLRSALYLHIRNTLIEVQNEDNEVTQGHVEKLKNKISILSKELSANVMAQHNLRDKVSQWENRYNDLLSAQHANENTIANKDKRIAALERELEALRNADHLHVEAEITDVALMRVELRSITEKYTNLQSEHHALIGQNKRLQADLQAQYVTIQEQLEANRLLREGMMQAQQFKADMITKTARTEAQLLATRAQLSAVDQAAALDRADQQVIIEESVRLAEEAKAEVQNLHEDIQYYKGLDFAQRTKIMSLEMQKEELAQRETRMQEQIMDLAYSTSHTLGADMLQGGSRSLAIGDFSSQSGTNATIKPIINYMRTKNESPSAIKRPLVDTNNIDLEIEELQNKIVDKFFQL